MSAETIGDLGHEMECARAAIAIRVEAATTRRERKEWMDFTRQMEREWKRRRAAIKTK